MVAESHSSNPERGRPPRPGQDRAQAPGSEEQRAARPEAVTLEARNEAIANILKLNQSNCRGLAECAPGELAKAQTWLQNLTGVFKKLLPAQGYLTQPKDTQKAEFDRIDEMLKDLAAEFKGLDAKTLRALTSDPKIAAQLAIVLKSLGEDLGSRSKVLANELKDPKKSREQAKPKGVDHEGKKPKKEKDPILIQLDEIGDQIAFFQNRVKQIGENTAKESAFGIRDTPCEDETQGLRALVQMLGEKDQSLEGALVLIRESLENGKISEKIDELKAEFSEHAKHTKNADLQRSADEVRSAGEQLSASFEKLVELLAHSERGEKSISELIESGEVREQLQQVMQGLGRVGGAAQKLAELDEEPSCKELQPGESTFESFEDLREFLAAPDLQKLAKGAQGFIAHDVDIDVATARKSFNAVFDRLSDETIGYEDLHGEGKIGPIGKEEFRAQANALLARIENIDNLLHQPQEILSGEERLYLILELEGLNGGPPQLSNDLIKIRAKAEAVFQDGTYDKGLGNFLIAFSDHLDASSLGFVSEYARKGIALDLSDAETIKVVAELKDGVNKVLRAHPGDKGAMRDDVVRYVDRYLEKNHDESSPLLAGRTKGFLADLLLLQAGIEPESPAVQSAKEQLKAFGRRAASFPDRAVVDPQKVADGSSVALRDLLGQKHLAKGLQQSQSLIQRQLTARPRYIPENSVMEKANFSNRSYSLKHASLTLERVKRDVEITTVENGQLKVKTEARFFPEVRISNTKGAEVRIPLDLNAIARKELVEGNTPNCHIKPTRLEQLQTEQLALQRMAHTAKTAEQKKMGDIGKIDMALTEVGLALDLESARLLKMVPDAVAELAGKIGGEGVAKSKYLLVVDPRVKSDRKISRLNKTPSTVIDFSNTGMQELLGLSSRCITSMKNVQVAKGSDLRCVDFTRIREVHPKGEVYVPPTILKNVTFNRVDLSLARFSGHTQSDFLDEPGRDYARPKFKIEKVHFNECVARNMQAGGLVWRGTCQANDTNFDLSNFNGANLGWSRFQYCSLMGDNFNLTAASFSYQERNSGGIEGEKAPSWAKSKKSLWQLRKRGEKLVGRQFSYCYFTEDSGWGNNQQYLVANKRDSINSKYLLKWAPETANDATKKLDQLGPEWSAFHGNRLTSQSERTGEDFENEPQHAFYRPDLGQRIVVRFLGDEGLDGMAKIRFEQWINQGGKGQFDHLFHPVG